MSTYIENPSHRKTNLNLLGFEFISLSIEAASSPRYAEPVSLMTDVAGESGGFMESVVEMLGRSAEDEVCLLLKEVTEWRGD